jgi:hypothetical protein
MHIEIDQSGKIENTQVPTVLAFSNHTAYTIFISAGLKRTCVHFLRSRYRQPTSLYFRIFAAGLFLLLEEWANQLDAVLIDTEYQGKEGMIKALLLSHLEHQRPDISDLPIRFGYVGKRSPVHHVAIATFRGQRPPDRVIGEEELLRLLGK